LIIVRTKPPKGKSAENSSFAKKAVSWYRKDTKCLLANSQGVMLFGIVINTAKGGTRKPGTGMNLRSIFLFFGSSFAGLTTREV